MSGLIFYIFLAVTDGKVHVTEPVFALSHTLFHSIILGFVLMTFLFIHTE